MIVDDLYDQLIRPIERQMKASVWRIVRDPDDADDAFQEAVARIWKQVGRVRRHPNPHALILRICINAAYDALRRKARRRHDALDDLPGGEVADPRPLPSETAAQRERVERLFRAIGRLPRKQALAVLMRFVQEQSYAEIAAAMGCSETTVRVHVNHGRHRLRTMLGPIPSANESEVFNHGEA